MKTRLEKSDGIIFLLALIGLGIFILLYPKLFPEASIRMDIGKEQILQRGTSFVENLGFDLSNYHSSVELNYNENQLRYLNRAFGTSRANDLMADSIPAFYWSIHWFARKDSSKITTIHIGGGEGSGIDSAHVNEIQLSVDMRGRPIEFIFNQAKENFSPKPSTILAKNNRAVAEKLSNKLINIYGGIWSFEKEERKLGESGTIYQYSWNREKKIGGESISLRVDVQNEQMHGFSQTFVIPKSFLKTKTNEKLEQILGIIFILILFLFFPILIIIYFIQRLRADLIDLKSGLVPAIIVILGWGISYWIQVAYHSREPGWQSLVGFMFTMLFVGGGIWVLFAVGESLTREVWPEKLTTLDTLRKRILFPQFGLALFRGIALVFLGLGLVSLLDYVSVNFFDGHFDLGKSPLYFWTLRWPSLYPLRGSFLSSLYIVVSFCLLVHTLLKQRFRKNVFILPILFLFWGLVSFPIPKVQPIFLNMIINGLIGLLFALFFLRYDFTTVATGAVGLPILFYSIAALEVGSKLFTLHGIILSGLLGVALLVAFLAYRGESPSPELVSYVPDYLKRIYEKERIKRELEIARNVQLSFLPRKNPEIEGIDIASLCIPAEEVGGDYYDFIEIDPKKLGVVIGDVSGKGISAAFYTTLTKGFLKSVARTVLSPKEVLINMNELFYQNAERGVFISMIYGVFDLNSGTLTFARAGHNPMILRRSGEGKTEELNSPGIALGLEQGNIFASTIEEKTIGIEKNDVFLFYTDGFNEARNHSNEEFGEKRLMQLVKIYDTLSAEKLLQKIQYEIQSFAAGVSQHDDMTAVIVKIL